MIPLGIMDGIYFILPALTKLHFYDTWLPWAITQSAVNIVLFFCLIKEYISANKTARWMHLGMGLLLFAFEADVIATAAGFWEGGFISKYVFFILFVAALFVVLRLIPESINAAEKAKALELQRSRLEAELKESRISIMLSQIQPHFIYNTLGTIERMCLKDPQKAFDLVRNFSLYLRGNFSELDSVAPIRFEEELKHIEYYVNIEKVRLLCFRLLLWYLTIVIACSIERSTYGTYCAMIAPYFSLSSFSVRSVAIAHLTSSR